MRITKALASFGSWLMDVLRYDPEDTALKELVIELKKRKQGDIK